MAADDFRQIKGNSFVLEGPVNIGLIDTADGAVLIDSGNDKDAGRRIYKKLRESGRTPAAVLNTHSNADHIGGNAYLQKNAGCEICAPAVESAFTESPYLEPAFLWGGYPFRELRSKFFQAAASKIDRVFGDGETIHSLRTVSLPGHFFNQAGLLSPDGVFYLGDSMFGIRIIQKYGLPFIYDVGEYLNSIEKIRSTEAGFYVPSHGDIVDDINPTADLNIKAVNDAITDIRRMIKQGCMFEDLLKDFFDARKLELNQAQYVLVGSTIKSFLSYMHDKGDAEYYFKDNRMYWKSK